MYSDDGVIFQPSGLQARNGVMLVMEAVQRSSDSRLQTINIFYTFLWTERLNRSFSWQYDWSLAPQNDRERPTRGYSDLLRLIAPQLSPAGLWLIGLPGAKLRVLCRQGRQCSPRYRTLAAMVTSKRPQIDPSLNAVSVA